ncbi:transposase [Kitasatospora sp. NPDC057904]|uniref:transposase n=1 Tax=unclassified Kitasatospora TaxID=2633591 RepID=UPI0036DD25E4
MDEMITEFRGRSLDQDPYALARVEALTRNVREDIRVVNVHCLVTVGVNNEGWHEVLGPDVATSADGTDWRTSSGQGTSPASTRECLATLPSHCLSNLSDTHQCYLPQLRIR